MMASMRIVCGAFCVGLLVALLMWLGKLPARADGGSRQTGPTSIPGVAPLRIGILPERDIFAQRRRFRAMGDYLGKNLNHPVELVTVTSYGQILDDLAKGQVDIAILGSLVAVLAVDRLEASLVAKAELADGTTTYSGTVFVRDDSPIRRIEDLAGKSVAMVRTTTAGHLYPMELIVQAKLFDTDQAPRPVFVGTHDDSILAVVERRVDAGAAKDLRLEEYIRAHPELKFRRLATSDALPDSAVVARKEIAATLGPRLRELLMKMPDDEQGRKALTEFGAKRFLPCELSEYKPLCEMICTLRPVWGRVGIDGAAPRELGCTHAATRPGK